MNKIIKLFFGIDLLAGLTLITTLISKMFFGTNQGLCITVSIIFALVNFVVTLIATRNFNFYKNVNEYVKK